MQQINEGNPVSLNMVNEYTELYVKDKLQLVPQERPWGFTDQAAAAPPLAACTYLLTCCILLIGLLACLLTWLRTGLLTGLLAC